MKSPRHIQAEGMARMIERGGTVATLPDGSTVRGLMVADGETARLAQFQGTTNVKTPDYYVFYTLSRIAEGLGVLVVQGERWTVTHTHPQYVDGAAAWYEVNLIGRGRAA